jgi:hypothetical protein
LEHILKNLKLTRAFNSNNVYEDKGRLEIYIKVGSKGERGTSEKERMVWREDKVYLVLLNYI